MVAPLNVRHINCTVLASESAYRDGRNIYRPSTLVPWADPYIAGLVRRLQSEVRFERAGTMSAELEPPCPSTDEDWQSWDTPRWSEEEPVR